MGFNEFWGNEHIKLSLKKILKDKRISNSYVFEGISGVGKRFCADIFARALVCEDAGSEDVPCDSCSGCKKAQSKNHPDIIRVTRNNDKQSIGVDEVREQILDEIYLKPYLAKRRVFIIGEGDILTPEAQNALLKVLEEPPSYATFIICVTKQDALLSTVLSRSFVFSFFPLSSDEIYAYLESRFSGKDKIRLASKISNGSIGNAIKFMSDENEEKLFLNSIEHLLNLKRDGAYTRKTADFIIQEKENIDKVTEFMLTFLRDCIFLASGAENQIMYDNSISKMRVFTENIDKKALVSAFDRLFDLKIRMKQKLNFSASVYETVVCIWEDFHDKCSGHKI